MANRRRKEELVSPESIEVQEFIKSQVWREFCLEVEQNPLFLYQYLVGLNIEGLGYLFFLEDILGQQEFRCLCPLVLIPDKVFAADFLSFPRWRLSMPKSRDLTFELLSEYYFKSQQRKASQYWPKAIDRYISNVIELVIRANFTKSLWEVYRTYLSVRYGFDNSFIPSEKPSRFSRKLRAWRAWEEGIVRAVWERIGAPKGMIYDIPDWEDNIRDAFTKKDVRSWLVDFASSFQRGNYRRWKSLVKRAEKRLGERLHTDSCFDVNSLLEVNLHEFFVVRIANTLSSNGVDTLADLIVLSRGAIIKFQGVGESILNDAEKTIGRFKLRLGMAERDIKEWKKKNKKIKFRVQE